MSSQISNETEHDESYPVDPQTKIRNTPRGAYDKETVHAILDAGQIAHVGFVDDNIPIVIPMIYARLGETLYIHGAKASRIAKLLKQGAQICLTVTHIDGIVAARSSFHSSLNYRSVVVFGVPGPVDDEDEKTAAVAAITNQVLPGRWQELRPSTHKELNATAVIKVKIEKASAKVRTGPPVEDPVDLEVPVWGGVIPVNPVYQTPIPDEHGAADLALPESVKKLFEDQA